MKLKYTLLRLNELTGMRVFDPFVKLIFRDEPKKQLGEIAKTFVTPILFVSACVIAWNVIAPMHKTKSGRVPTPGEVISAAKINKRFYERESEKQADFLADPTTREERVAVVNELIASTNTKLDQQQADLDAAEMAHNTDVEKRVAPLNKLESRLKQLHKITGQARESLLAEAATATSQAKQKPSYLVDLVQASDEAADQERQELAKIRERRDRIRGEIPEELRSLRKETAATAIELQHLKSRIEYLTTRNRSGKMESLFASSTQPLSVFRDPTTTAQEHLKAAELINRKTNQIQDTSQQDFPAASTIVHQTKRSVFTVFVGFILAAAIAIPIGIVCGLNRVVMACFTPIISIFKPVSPVVWLLIFQIIIGAFFLKPDSHPLILACDNTWGLAGLRVNPAMIFSACTVAMCAVWPALTNTALGVASVDKDHLNVAKVLRLGLWQRLTKIIIPSALPLMFAGLRISMGVGWMVLIAAEALSSSEGLGKFVWDEYQNGSSHSFANIVLAVFIVGFIGFLLDRLMIILQQLVSFGESKATV
ncbi:MAG: ABC transporter permease subunit [Planctomycetota bacterium]